MKDMEALRERIMEMIEEIEDLSGAEYEEVSTELSTLTRAIEEKDNGAAIMATTLSYAKE